MNGSSVDRNPYRPPHGMDGRDAAPRLDRRFAFLILPPLIPFVVHVVVRQFVPASETIYHAAFAWGTVLLAWIWSDTMVGRLKLSWPIRFFLSACLWAAVVASALASPMIVDWCERQAPRTTRSATEKEIGFHPHETLREGLFVETQVRDGGPKNRFSWRGIRPVCEGTVTRQACVARRTTPTLCRSPVMRST